MKETYYFSHDYNARSDEKIKRLIRRHGMTGYGIFWSIIEDLYQNTNVLRTEYDGIAYELRADVEMVKSVINDFDLFTINGDEFSSTSVEYRLNKMAAKSQKAANSVRIRWEKEKSKTEPDTNVLRPKYERNTIKENIIKENKVNVNTPTREEFVQYGLGILGNDTGYKSPLEAKFETWMQDGWKDGHGKPIKNWKTKLQNVAPFLKPLRLVPVESNQVMRRELT